MQILHREGYGNAFNTLFIDDDKLRKESKDDYGKKKLQSESNFYRTCISNAISFPIPEILTIQDTHILMKFYHTHAPLYQVYWSATAERRKEILCRIKEHLHVLHQNQQRPCTTEIIQRDLYEETFTKIMIRFEEVRSIIESYDIHAVNSIQLLSFQDSMVYIQKKIGYFSEMIENQYRLIHGDCQFSNILYSDEDDSFIFIDPRGYFGRSELFGLPQYDFAKILFAQSGYDVFDKMKVENLVIDKGNLLIKDIPCEENIFSQINLELILMISIWLGNAHCFRQEPKKAVLSHFYARYLATLVYMSDMSFTM